MNVNVECIVVGAAVERHIAEKFEKKLGDISTTEAITWFIYQIATDQMHIERMDGAE